MHLAQNAALASHTVGDATETFIDESHDAAFLSHAATHNGALSACVHQDVDGDFVDLDIDKKHSRPRKQLRLVVLCILQVIIDIPLLNDLLDSSLRFNI